ncbi:MAG TPA: 50S ribosomal protein L11 [Candidatus Deferrimicrobium sp.]|nr:50S ribosomal protein L11 [Candidatus Deferrimicrobium sp.]
MTDTVTIEALFEGGHASAGPPIGPALGPTGVNLYQVVQKINELSQDFAGLKIPVKITVNTTTKEFDIELGIPPSSALILREIKDVQKGSSEAGKKMIGNVSLDTIIKTAKMKKNVLLSTNLKAAVKEIIGTCVSMGVKVDGKLPKTIQKNISKGLYDTQLNEAL